MEYLTMEDTIKDIQKRINDMENKAYYETKEDDILSQLAIYKSSMVQISAAVSVLKNINDGMKIKKTKNNN